MSMEDEHGIGASKRSKKKSKGKQGFEMKVDYPKRGQRTAKNKGRKK